MWIWIVRLGNSPGLYTWYADGVGTWCTHEKFAKRFKTRAGAKNFAMKILENLPGAVLFLERVHK